VIMTPLSGSGSTPWTKWGMSKYFDYVDPNVPDLKEVYQTKQRFKFLGTVMVLDVENIDGRVKLDAEDLRRLGLKVGWDEPNKTVVVELPHIDGEQ